MGLKRVSAIVERTKIKDENGMGCVGCGVGAGVGIGVGFREKTSKQRSPNFFLLLLLAKETKSQRIGKSSNRV